MGHMPAVRFVDVFSETACRGNALAVFHDADDLSDEQMATIARWTKLSETTFLFTPTDPAADYRVRIWTTGGELPFAGHPIIGAAAVLHKRTGADGAQSWRYQLPGKTVENHDGGHGRRLLGFAGPGRAAVLGRDG